MEPFTLIVIPGSVVVWKSYERYREKHPKAEKTEVVTGGKQKTEAQSIHEEWAQVVAMEKDAGITDHLECSCDDCANRLIREAEQEKMRKWREEYDKADALLREQERRIRAMQELEAAKEIAKQKAIAERKAKIELVRELRTLEEKKARYVNAHSNIQKKSNVRYIDQGYL